MVAVFSQPFGESWDQVGQLALALGLASLIGLERELRQRSAGLRTHALVAVHSVLRVNSRDREGVLRRVLALCTQQRFTVGELATDQLPDEEQTLGIVAVTLRISGTQPVPELVASLTEIPGVLGIATSDPDDPD